MLWNRISNHLLRLWTLVPWIAIATFYGAVQSSKHCSYHRLPFTLPECLGAPLQLLLVPLFFALLASPIVYPIGLGINKMQVRQTDWRISLGIFTFGWATVMFLLATDPGHIIACFMD